ncbi:MAG TPA: DUF5723 family protein [Lentimicrobium sp.]|nr:DUF5723 family protein [Lentimicrobium sp.]
MLMFSNSTWAGTNSTIINPSLPVLSPLYLDINLVSANVSVENNYIYIPASENKFRRFFNNSYLNGNEGASTFEKFYFDYYTPETKSGFINVRVTGPSASLILGRNAFGFHTAVRSITSVQDIPGPLAKFLYEGMYWPEQHNIRYLHENKMSIANLSWAEIGFNYSHIFRIRNKDIWSGGFTLRKLSGYGGAVIFSDHIDYMMQGSDTLVIYDIDAEGGYSLPLDYNSNLFDKDEYSRGDGFGMDIGITFEKKKSPPGWVNRFSKPCTQHFTPYKYRIGLSLLDIGRITFKENARSFRVDDGSLFWPGLRGINNTTVSAMEDSISTHFFGNHDDLVTGDRFSMDLPAVLSSQIDYNLNGNWYATSVVIVPISDKRTSLRPPEIIGGLRVETRDVTFGINASVLDWSAFRLGFFGRYEWFFVGTDNILSFLQVKDYTGTDIFAGLKISLNKGRCTFNNTACPGLLW